MGEALLFSARMHELLAQELCEQGIVWPDEGGGQLGQMLH